MIHDQLVNHFREFSFESKKWKFIDFRINIPPLSFGSDAINPHTQYSNPIAVVDYGDFEGVGASFTLGYGNQMVCEAAQYIVEQLDGCSMSELIASDKGFYESIANPLQLRWLSPNAGLPMMAAGLIFNTVLDVVAKKCDLPAWEFLAKLPSEFLLSLSSLRHFSPSVTSLNVKEILDSGYENIEQRCQDLHKSALPVYFTTWIGHTAESIAEQINEQYSRRGIEQFKLKIDNDVISGSRKLKEVKNKIPKNLTLCVDANQTLSLAEASNWLENLSDMGIQWLEEPFAPDNTLLFRELIKVKDEKKLTCEVVTGENCPNYHTAESLMSIGIDRFQADPCRMLGLLDSVLITVAAKIKNCIITPHAGGSSLDEQSPHIQLFNLARVSIGLDPGQTLTENVGFCSHLFANPTVVKDGAAAVPSTPGLLVGLEPKATSKFKNFTEGITRLEL